MKKTTFLVIAVILLSVIVEESNGKITILTHMSIGRSPTEKRGRRRPVTKSPKTYTKTGRNHSRFPVKYSKWHESPKWLIE
ncbi:hypothetical protein OS493_017260 [Desmophyllum pertusum]|uniref:Uncharacterized protein n=1 Tax=Desmophyllum pertusum TaxID=174260 RepID=A0A9X0A2D1_9CNID|nr:hypothetical protein OS493_017260 [Desmophyllum pertusum]